MQRVRRGAWPWRVASHREGLGPALGRPALALALAVAALAAAAAARRRRRPRPTFHNPQPYPVTPTS